MPGPSRSSAAASGPSRAARFDSRLLAARRDRRGPGAARPRPRSSTPTGPSSGPPRTSRASARRVTGLPVLNRRDAEADDERLRDARRPVRVHRRRLAAAPALGAEGQRALRRAALRVRPRRGDRGVRRGRDGARATRWSIRAAARTRSGSGSCPASRSSRTTRARPTTCANGRSTCCPPTRCSSASTSRPRSCATGDGRGTSWAPARATVYRKGVAVQELTDGETVDARSRSYAAG